MVSTRFVISMVKALYLKEGLVTENSEEARGLYHNNRYGNMDKEGRVSLALIEGLFLVEKNQLEVYDRRNHKILFEEYLKKSIRNEADFWVRYRVFKNLRERGYIVKTALKFGADFRVYDRGVLPGEDHAKWIVYPVSESKAMTWYEFAAKNRVAHSTKKRLLLGVVDGEGDVSYWECRWVRP